MDFKKKMKNFFTLTRKANGGFTLVELIVVIAILAILAGVGIPVYSGYITKANMGVDESLAGEIKQALILAHYSGKLTPGDYVVVSCGAPAVASSNTADAAMVAVFGADWKNTLNLKYDGWSAELGVVANKEAMENVQNSTFNGNALGYLLGDVQSVVDQFSGFLVGNATVNQEMGDYLREHGVNIGADNKVTSENINAVSNAAPMFVANNITNAAAKKNGFADYWAASELTVLVTGNVPTESFDTILVNGNNEQDVLANAAAGFARVEAMANWVDEQNKANGVTSTYAQDLRNSLTNATDAATITNLIAATEGSIMSTNFKNYCNYFGITGENIPDDITGYDEAALMSLVGGLNATNAGSNSQAYKDGQAFLTYMDGLQGAADSIAKDMDLNSSNFYNDKMVNYVQDYMEMGDILGQVGAEDGSFVFLYNGSSVQCVPIDYD